MSSIERRYLIQEDYQGEIASLIEGLTWQEMLDKGIILGPQRLKGVLEIAVDYLTTTPGPNLARRQELAPQWLGWWIDYVSQFITEESNPRTVSSKKVVHLEKMRERLRDLRRESASPSFTSGVILMAGGEGNLGHRGAVDHIAEYTKAVMVLLEQEEFLRIKARGVPYLPLVGRLTMWALYPKTSLVGVTPLREPNISQSAHYRGIVRRSGATYSFATEGDPNEKEKRERATLADFTLIPKLPVASTTETVERMFAEDTFFEELL